MGQTSILDQYGYSRFASQTTAGQRATHRSGVLDRSLRDKGLGTGVRKGRTWAYARDQRPWAGAAAPRAVYDIAPEWKEDHVHQHLRQTRGILQGEEDQQRVRAPVCPTHVYKGYAKLCEPEPDGTARFPQAACPAHLRSDFHDIRAAPKSEIAREALDRIRALCDMERVITGQPADLRLAARTTQSRPKVEAFVAWSEQQLPRIPGKGDLAKAFRSGPSRMPGFILFLEDGRVAIVCKDDNMTDSNIISASTGTDQSMTALTPLSAFALKRLAGNG